MARVILENAKRRIKYFSDCAHDNNTVIEDGIHAIAVFRRKEFIISKGYETEAHRCVFVERAKLPTEWPMADDGTPLTLISIFVDLDEYIGKPIRLCMLSNTGGCGEVGILKYQEFEGFTHPHGFHLDVENPVYFGNGDVVEVSRWGDDDAEIIIRLGFER